jgi:hypothetical protein
MSKIPYASEKIVKKAKDKFMKELKKDKSAELVYVRDLDIEQEIRAYFKEEVPQIEEKIELEILEAMKRKEEAKEYLTEQMKKKALEEAAAAQAYEEIPSTQDTDDAEADAVVDPTEPTESGDREQ